MQLLQWRCNKYFFLKNGIHAWEVKIEHHNDSIVLWSGHSWVLERPLYLQEGMETTGGGGNIGIRGVGISFALDLLLRNLLLTWPSNSFLQLLLHLLWGRTVEEVRWLHVSLVSLMATNLLTWLQHCFPFPDQTSPSSQEDDWEMVLPALDSPPLLEDISLPPLAWELGKDAWQEVPSLSNEVLGYRSQLQLEGVACFQNVCQRWGESNVI